MAKAPARKAIEAGVVGDGLPAVRMGHGSQALVMFPSLSDSLGDLRGALGYLARHYRAYANRYEFWIVGRRPDMPDGFTTRDMAADYAEALKGQIGGKAHIIGMSTGGMAAQHLAHEWPELVERLVLFAAPARAGGEARAILTRWQRMGEAGAWKDYYRDSALASFTGWKRGLYATVFGWLGREPEFPDDFLISLDAMIDHDGEAALRAIETPVLVTGGTEDPVFPPYLMQEAADMIPGATFQLFEGGGHGALDQYRKDFEPMVLDFLAGADAPG